MQKIKHPWGRKKASFLPPLSPFCVVRMHSCNEAKPEMMITEKVLASLLAKKNRTPTSVQEKYHTYEHPELTAPFFSEIGRDVLVSHAAVLPLLLHTRLGINTQRAEIFISREKTPVAGIFPRIFILSGNINPLHRTCLAWHGTVYILVVWVVVRFFVLLQGRHKVGGFFIS